MRIVDVDLSELDSATKRGRSRSEEMQELISTIESLKPGDAKAIVASNDNPAKRIRSRLLYAARIAGKRLQIGENDGRVIFAINPRPRKRRRTNR